MLASGTVMAADFCTGGADAIVALRSALSSSPIEWLHFTGHSTYPVQSAEALSTNSGDLIPSVMEDIAAALDVADGFAPVHVNHTPDAGLRAILRLVRGTAGKRLATHSAASIEYDELSLRHTGRREIERATGILEPDFLVRLTYADVADLTRARDAGIGAVMCPRAMACLGRMLPSFLVAVDLGLMVGLGTDNAMTSTSSMLDEMGFCARVQSSSAVFDMHGDGLQSSTDAIAAPAQARGCGCIATAVMYSDSLPGAPRASTAPGPAAWPARHSRITGGRRAYAPARGTPRSRP